jgi:Transposase IS4
VRAVFGSEFKKKLLIPKVVDDYNHHMNGIDVADQLRSYYNTQQAVRRNWMPLFFWLLDTAIINAYRITRTLGLTQEQKEFRHELVWDLIDIANNTREIQLRSGTKREIIEETKKETKWPKVTKNFELSNQRFVSGNHFAEWRKRRESCQWCTWLASKKNLDLDRKTPHQSQLWCLVCNVPLCCNSNHNCFVDFHTKKNNNNK